MSTDRNPPPVIPGHEHVGHLGSGGYAEVYLYERRSPKLKVAVKVLNGDGVTDAARRQFTAEANAMAELSDHPFIVQVYDADVTADGRPYIVMKYFPLPNLSVRARREQFSVADVLRIGIQISGAVETAHRAGILHRDIKPANILSGQYGATALTDFGIAVTKGGEDEEEAEGLSVPWAPPEVLFSSGVADERSDVYSLAATVWNLLVGRSPFEVPGGDNSTPALMRRIQTDAPPPTGRSEVPESLERLLQMALAKAPQHRPASALDFARGLQGVEREQRLNLTTIVIPEDVAPATTPDQPTTDDTFVRRPTRIEPHQSSPAPGSTTRRRTGEGLPPLQAGLEGSSAPNPPPQRLRVGLPAPAEIAGTVRRPTVVAPPPTTPSTTGSDPRPTRAARMPRALLIGAAVILVALAVGAGVLVTRDGSNKSTTKHQEQQVAPQDPAADVAPPVPSMNTPTRAGDTVTFTWTDPSPGDTFLVFNSESGAQISQKPLTVPSYRTPVSAGSPFCIEVKTLSAQNVASQNYSDSICAPTT